MSGLTLRGTTSSRISTAAECSFHAVMLQPCWVPLAKDMLRGTAVRVASAIAYPLGGETTAMKVHLARELVRINVDKVRFQANVGFLRSDMDTEFATEIRAIVEAADGRSVKSMSEFGLLSEEQQIRCIRIAEEAGVASVKNSSGVGPGGSPATPCVIRFMRTHLRGRAKIKASGGIATRQQAIDLLEAGAELLGASAAPAIVGRALAARTGY
jgi:deoxyribose-phosphate aldolase